MTLTFYPHEDDAQRGSHSDRMAMLLEAAERYKAAILETRKGVVEEDKEKRMAPVDIEHAYNWQEIANILVEIRDLPEASEKDRALKADLLTKLAEVYEVLRGAKMSKLEAIRLALLNEAKMLIGKDKGI